MSDVNVLVVFYSRYGKTEKVATAAGVGAIQAQANIRLRRLQDLTDPARIEQDAEWKATLDRMKVDYIAPREADTQWADVVLVASAPDARTEMSNYLASLLKTSYSKPIFAVADPVSALAEGKRIAEETRQRKIAS
jgi:hypothetical protein